MPLVAERPCTPLWQDYFDCCNNNNNKKHSTVAMAPVLDPEFRKRMLMTDHVHKSSSIEDLVEECGMQGIGRLHEPVDPIRGLPPDLRCLYQRTCKDGDKGASNASSVASSFKHSECQQLSGVNGCKDLDKLPNEASELGILCMEKGLEYPHWMEDLPSMDDLILISRMCRKHLFAAKHLLLHVHLTGLECQLPLGNHLLQMFIECGSVSDAQQVFSRLAHFNEFSWTSLMQGYIECGQSEHAFVLFQNMQTNGIPPSSHTFMALLKACARLKNSENGQALHSQIIEDSFEFDTCIGNSLVVMYAKCGLLAEARDILEEFLIWDVVSCNALIAGYAEHGFSEEALRILDKMNLEGIPSNAITSLGSLKACGSLRAVSKGQEIHAEMVKKGHEMDSFVSSSLVDTYAKCGLLAEALNVFHGIEVRGVVLWTALIAGYVEYGLGEDALCFMTEMRSAGVSPNAVTYVFGLKACIKVQAFNKGRELHIEIVKGAFESDSFVKNALIDMYVKGGLVLEAHEVLDASPDQDLVSWNTLVSGYIERGLNEEVQDAWICMQQEGVLPNDKTFVCILKACGILGSVNQGREAHMEVVKFGLELQPLLGSILVDMYANCVLLTEAQNVFDELEIRDVVSWNAVIAGYSEHGCGEQALRCLQQMQLDGVSPDDVTFMMSLKACSSIGSICRSFTLHSDIILGGFDTDSFVGNSLVGMYVTSGLFAEAWKVLDELPVISIISWNAMLAGYCEIGHYQEVLACIENMQSQGLLPNAVTYVCILNACGSKSAIEKGLLLHADIVKKGIEIDPYVGSALVDMYAKFGSLAEAQGVFDELRLRDVVSWSALISGYAMWGLDEVARSFLQKMQSESVLPNVVSWNGVLSSYGEEGDTEKAFSVYAQMQEQGLLPDGVTFLCILRSCGSTTGLRPGKVIHAQICGLRGVEANQETLATALTDMYGKCGSMLDAQMVFVAMPEWDLSSWTALVAGYARQGETELVLSVLEKMDKVGVKPNGITFSGVLSACSHAGLVETGQLYFTIMSRNHKITPDSEHYISMIDLFARAGQLDEAVAMIEKLPSIPNLAIWTALLGACRKWGNVDHGKVVFEFMLNEDNKQDAALILMSKIYAEASLWDDADEMENLRMGLETSFIPENG